MDYNEDSEGEDNSDEEEDETMGSINVLRVLDNNGGDSTD